MKSSFPFFAAAWGVLLASPHVALADGPLPVVPPPTAQPWPAPAAPSTPPPRPPPTPPPTVLEWYGWETLIVDGASLAVGVAAAAGNQSGAAPYLGGGASLTYLFGPPIVHLAHQRWTTALADFGIRVGGVIAGGLLTGAVGAAVGGPCSGDSCNSSLNGFVYGIVIGAGLGALTASAIDASVLARVKVRADAEPVAGLTWGPSLRMVRDGAVGGVSGTF